MSIQGTQLEDATDQFHTISAFPLENGQIIPELTQAYVTFGELSKHRNNAILLPHGFTSGHRLAELSYRGGHDAWRSLIGPGMPIDTGRFFVVSPNVIGSAYGSTGPRSINPNTGRAYRTDFPEITLVDIVRAQRALIDHLNIAHLHAIVGASFGGFQGFQWAESYPDMVNGVVATCCALWPPQGRVMNPRSNASSDSSDPREDESPLEVLTKIRLETFSLWGLGPEIERRIPDPMERQTYLRREASAWAKEFDLHSISVLGKAIRTSKLLDGVSHIRAKILYLLASSDVLYPPTLAPTMMETFAGAGVDAIYVELESDRGHLASQEDGRKWADTLRAFLDQL
jgi:homoserine O-acetyltransferase